jgi:hypothetical protein
MKVKDFLSEKQLQCLKAVQKINNEMYNKEGWRSHDTLLNITICSWYFAVSININKANTEIQLFNSEQDDRIYYELSDKYEEFYSYLKRKYREAKEIVNDIKL